MTAITSEFLKHKAREISYALNRVSFYIKREELRNRLERLSFEFLENAAVAAEDASDKQALIRVFKNISALDVLIRIGHSLYEIETVNSNILLREVDSFSSAIRQLAETSSAMTNSSEFGKVNSANPIAREDLNLESMFSMPPAIIKETANSAIENVSVGVKSEFGNSAIRQSSDLNDQTSGSSIKDEKDFANIDNEKDIVERAYSSVSEKEKGIVSEVMGDRISSQVSVKDSVPACQAIIRKFQNGIAQQVRDESGNRTIRQNLISEKIRQSGKANVKELVGQFPGVSERTLRYDLQKLCDQGVIEKIGSSGPGTSYSPKDQNS
jgi:hypothetical protein